jgi:hypothetical protein
MENGQLRFDGQIKWYKGQRTLQWSVPKWNAKKKRFIYFIEKAVFESGDLTTDFECRERLASFTMQPQRAEQFKLVQPIITRLWQALIDQFGYPTMEKW